MLFHFSDEKPKAGQLKVRQNKKSPISTGVCIVNRQQGLVEQASFISCSHQQLPSKQEKWASTERQAPVASGGGGSKHLGLPKLSSLFPQRAPSKLCPLSSSFRAMAFLASS